MDYIKVSAKTVSDAIIEAAIQLETSSDNIEYKVIENGSSGFLGFGIKPAVVQARKKESIENDYFSSASYAAKEEQNVKKEPAIKESPKKEYIKKEPVKNEPVKKESFDYNKSDEDYNDKDIKTPKVPINKEEVEAAADTFLNDVFAAMEMSVKVTSQYSDETLNVDLIGEDMGVLIGKRGQTLDSLQYLTSLVVNKGKSSYTRVKLDTENYRNRRKETLENLAKNISFKVKKTKRPVFLEPMNPYERRIIHSTLQNDPSVTTHSEGEEPYRKVVVTLKK